MRPLDLLIVLLCALLWGSITVIALYPNPWSGE
jgi:hypothetical protein